MATTVYYYYAIVDGNNICTDVLRSRTVQTDSCYIEISIDQYNDTYDDIQESDLYLIGKRYDENTGEWVSTTQPSANGITKEDLQELENNLANIISNSIANINVSSAAVKSIQRGFYQYSDCGKLKTFDHPVDASKSIVIIDGQMMVYDGETHYMNGRIEEFTNEGIRLSFYDSNKSLAGGVSFQIVEFC